MECLNTLRLCLVLRLASHRSISLEIICFFCDMMSSFAGFNPRAVQTNCRVHAATCSGAGHILAAVCSSGSDIKFSGLKSKEEEASCFDFSVLTVSTPPFYFPWLLGRRLIKKSRLTSCHCSLLAGAGGWMVVSAELLVRDCRGHAPLRGRAQPRPDRSQASGNRWIDRAWSE